jgi:hypothetical protein
VPAWVGWFQETTTLTFAMIPAAIGVAILRHRLHNIDRLINRTLVYAGLTGVLTLAYLALVTLLQSVVKPVTGDSKITVAMSTLAVAALFRPLRTRIQAFIDRRFTGRVRRCPNARVVRLDDTRSGRPRIAQPSLGERRA